MYEGGIGRRRVVARDTKVLNPLRDKEEEDSEWKRETRKKQFFPWVSLLIKMIMDHGTNKGPLGRQKEMYGCGGQRDMPLTLSFTTYMLWELGKSLILSKSLFSHL